MVALQWLLHGSALAQLPDTVDRVRPSVVLVGSWARYRQPASVTSARASSWATACAW